MTQTLIVVTVTFHDMCFIFFTRMPSQYPFASYVVPTNTSVVFNGATWRLNKSSVCGIQHLPKFIQLFVTIVESVCSWDKPTKGFANQLCESEKK